MIRSMFLRYLDPDPEGNQGGGDPAAAPTGGDPTTVVVTPTHGDPNPPPTYTPPELDLAQAIPPEYRDKPYFQKLQSFEQMVKEFDGLQGLLGRRPTGVPAENATPEEWDTFFSALRPKDPSEYELPETEYSKAHGRDENYVKAMTSVLHKAGVNKHQAKIIAEGNDQAIMDLRKQAQEKEAADLAARDAEFDTKLKETFRDKLDSALARNKELIQKHVPAELQPHLANLPNDALLAVTTLLNDIHEKYVKADSFEPNGGPTSGADPAALQAEGRKLMASDAYKDFRHANHDAVVNKVREIYSQIAAAQKNT